MIIQETLNALGITLPEPTPPLAAFVPFVRTGELVYISGHISKQRGKLGADVTVEEGKEAARLVAIDLLGTLKAAVEDLERVRRIVKLLVLVNSTVEFSEQHLVANGASELLRKVFGDKGAHARSAFGVAQLPFGAAVEIELIAEAD
ncbi:MAG TPA: RidA family protein [Thermoanaerobaculia bacterium]|jgi:enamine deaminase RidA (YjgF/YER057c/UK114 family)|nr:RidA family protein [Thermoanaerobaculia bacterium]